MHRVLIWGHFVLLVARTYGPYQIFLRAPFTRNIIDARALIVMEVMKRLRIMARRALNLARLPIK